VVAWGPGFRSDLALEWEAFKAARTALAGTRTHAHKALHGRLALS
jgi:hypothetical protein